eukprot:jgi/Ulvmu1/6132/UM027_0110.1
MLPQHRAVCDVIKQFALIRRAWSPNSVAVLVEMNSPVSLHMRARVSNTSACRRPAPTPRHLCCRAESKPIILDVDAPPVPETAPPDEGAVDNTAPDTAEQPLPSGKPHDDPEYLPPGEANMTVEAAPKTATITRSIVFVTSEAAPFSKTGGLGDVCGSLPKALAARGHRVMVVLPRYSDEYGDEYARVAPELDDIKVNFFTKYLDGVDFLFVDHPSYRRPGGMYGDENGVYGDNQWRFRLLCHAALEAPLQVQLGEEGSRTPYGQDCIFVANDWFAGLVPLYLAARYRPGGVYLGARCVLLIHNLRHQGVYSPSTFESLGLPGDWYGALEWQYPPEQRMGAYEEEGRAINTLKGAITTADRIIAVSPGYAYEIQTPLGGWGMEMLLGGRQYALNGVLNGIDYAEWDPATDAHLPANYSLDDLPELKGKAACKRAMQEELHLPVNPDVPLLAFIGRLDSQKGADLILQAAPWIVQEGAQLVCLGTGDPVLESGLRWMESEFPNNARGWVGFNVPFSHRLTAAADVLLMPSRFEPCGLNQLYAMRYGTIPVAHATGGLRDTVKTFDPTSPEGTTGWAFEGCDVDSLKGAIWNAMSTYKSDKTAWQGLQRRGMEQDFTWNHAAEQYEQIFEWAKTDLPYCG